VAAVVAQATVMATVVAQAAVMVAAAMQLEVAVMVKAAKASGGQREATAEQELEKVAVARVAAERAATETVAAELVARPGVGLTADRRVFRPPSRYDRATTDWTQQVNFQ